MISVAVFLRGNSPKYSSMYWISSAPVSSGYCLIRYSTSFSESSHSSRKAADGRGDRGDVLGRRAAAPADDVDQPVLARRRAGRRRSRPAARRSHRRRRATRRSDGTRRGRRPVAPASPADGGRWRCRRPQLRPTLNGGDVGQRRARAASSVSPDGSRPAAVTATEIISGGSRAPSPRRRDVEDGADFVQAGQRFGEQQVDAAGDQAIASAPRARRAGVPVGATALMTPATNRGWPGVGLGPGVGEPRARCARRPCMAADGQRAERVGADDVGAGPQIGIVRVQRRSGRAAPAG